MSQQQQSSPGAMPMAPPPVNPSDMGRGPMILGLTWTFSGIAIIAVALRSYVRVKVTRGLGLDDWLMNVAVVVNIVSQAFVTVAFTYGFGKHDADLRPDQMINILKWMWLANTPGLIVAILARLSIAVLLIRLFGVHEWLKWFLLVVTGICTILTCVIIPCTYLQSDPVSANWNPMIPAKRWDPIIYISLAYLGQSLWTFTDLTYVLLPILIIWRLQMALRQRVGLVLLMSMSLLTMTMSILKTISLSRIAAQQANPTATDVQYNATLTILYSCLEQAFVIIMGCVPPLRSASRLPIARTISNSLGSILRTKSSGKSEDEYKIGASDGPYEDLELSSDGRRTAGSGNRSERERSTDEGKDRRYLKYERNEHFV